MFSQCLVSVVTSFAHSLVMAIKGQLNPGVEYENKNQDASRQWLQMVAKKGLLVHMQSTMLPNEVGLIMHLYSSVCYLCGCVTFVGYFHTQKLVYCKELYIGIEISI